MEKDRERAPRGAKRARKKVCMFCADRVEKIDYKDINRLKKCMTERANLLILDIRQGPEAPAPPGPLRGHRLSDICKKSESPF